MLKTMILPVSKKKRVLSCLRSLFMIVFATFFLSSCNSNSDASVTGNLINAFALIDWDNVPLPELTQEETALVDSISKLKEFAEYHKCNKELMKKFVPYLEQMSKEEQDELRKNGTDSLYLSEFTAKVRAQLNIEEELKAMDKACKAYEEEIKTLKLSTFERVALMIKLYQ